MKQIQEGQYLCLEGTKTDSLFIVKSGHLEGSSKKNPKSILQFEAGSLIGELSLLNGAPIEASIRATEDSEIMEISQQTMNDVLANKSSWIKSILSFLTNRLHIAQENKNKNDLIQALPSLLYIFSRHIAKTESDAIPLEWLYKKIGVLNGTTPEDVDNLLQSLQKLDVVKILGKTVHAKSLNIISLLYETLQYRAINKKVSPNILSMTDQMILSTFIKLTRENNAPLKNGLSAIPTKKLREEAKKSMHGFTLTTRTIAPLVQRRLLEPSCIFNIHEPIDKIDFFYGDFDKILDLLELNRIFPLLDKNL